MWRNKHKAVNRWGEERKKFNLLGKIKKHFLGSSSVVHRNFFPGLKMCCGYWFKLFSTSPQN
jgi:hypothetical protein